MNFCNLVVMKHITFYLIILVFGNSTLFGQTDSVALNYLSEYYFESVLPYSAYTSSYNQNNTNYLYAACRELGVVTFNVEDVYHPIPVDTVPLIAFNNFKPTNLSQNGNYLYVSTGGFDGFTQNAGLAILDISIPNHPVIKDLWDSVAFNQGAAIAISDGAFAYLGAMDKGVIILDVSDKTKIKYLSSILPDPNFPEVPDLFSVPNARGLWMLNDNELLVANDAGGLRKIDISNKNAPVEMEKYANVDIEAIAQSAYNNIVVIDHYAYITVDFCGLEVVDLNTNPMSNVFWFNPWDCDLANWDGGQGHTNNLKTVGDSLLFVSGGDSELLVFDITNPVNPVLAGSFATPFDSIATWSLDVNYPYVSLALIDNSIWGVPFYSNVGGIMLLEANVIKETSIINHTIDKMFFYPNPVNEKLYLANYNLNTQIYISDITGKLMAMYTNVSEINCSTLVPGLYSITVFTPEGVLIAGDTFVKN